MRLVEPFGFLNNDHTGETVAGTIDAKVDGASFS
jgi:hypothetical protein